MEQTPIPPGETRSPRPQKGALLDVDVTGLAFGGDAIARHDGYVLFIKHVAPGDRVRVRVTQTKKNFGEAQAVELLARAPDRVEPVCSLAGTCGGCTYQHLSMETQRRWKTQFVRDALRPLPGGDAIPVKELVSSPADFRYRNKVEFTFQRKMDGRLVGGFHRPGNWREILDVAECHLAPTAMSRILRAAIEEGERQSASAWDGRIHTGTLRHLVLRHSAHEDTVLALMLTGDRSLDFPAMAKAMFAAEPTLRGVAWGLNSGESDIARASEILGTEGADSFEERLADLHFRVSLASFFQTNTRGAERLYSVTRDALELTGRERLLDAYCGTGTIGLFCAHQVQHVYGIELIQEAIWDARANAVANGITNATFLAGDMRFALPQMLNTIEGRIDRLVVDPPRGGMEGKALDQLLAIRATRVVYVSCNPTTMSRDLGVALEAGYRIDEVTPVDMFPQTYHVECVAKLTLPPP